MKKLILIVVTCFILFNYGIVNCQSKPTNYYFIKGRDTVFCSILVYQTNAQGVLTYLTYTDMDGKVISMSGKKNVPDVNTFCIGGEAADKVPINPNKPDGYYRYFPRAVDGKLIVYCPGQETISVIGNTTVAGNPSNAVSHSSPGYSNVSTTHQGQSGPYIFFLKMPDGTIYKINKKSNMEDYIKPHLLACREFAKQYKGDFSSEEAPFMESIKLYNSVCN
jgi:hypothetical protein